MSKIAVTISMLRQCLTQVDPAHSSSIVETNYIQISCVSNVMNLRPLSQVCLYRYHNIFYSRAVRDPLKWLLFSLEVVVTLDTKGSTF